MSMENPLWGAPRIHGELLKLGFEVAQFPASPSTWSNGGLPPSQDGEPSCIPCARTLPPLDLLVVPTIGFDLLYAFVIGSARPQRAHLDQRHSKSHGQNGLRVKSRMHPLERGSPLHDPEPVNRILPVRRHTPMRAMGIRDKPIAPASPWQKTAFAERLIGSIRRECLDHIIVWAGAPTEAILPKAKCVPVH